MQRACLLSRIDDPMAKCACDSVVFKMWRSIHCCYPLKGGLSHTYKESVFSLQQSANSTNFLAGAGCSLLFESNSFQNNLTHRLKLEWEHVVGDWVFDTASLYTSGTLGIMRVNKFSQHVQQRIDCTESPYCHYIREQILTDRVRKLTLLKLALQRSVTGQTRWALPSLLEAPI